MFRGIHKTILLWYFSRLRLYCHSFLSSCLSRFFGDVFFIWRSSCMIRGSEKQDGEGSGRGNTDVRENCCSKQTLFSVVAHDTHEKDGDPTQGCWLVATMLTCGVCNRARDTLHILLILSVHLYQSLCISPPPFICHSFQSPLLSLHPRVSPPSATFIYSSQLSVHSIPPQSSTTLPPLIHKHISQSMFTKAETH